MMASRHRVYMGSQPVHENSMYSEQLDRGHRRRKGGGGAGGAGAPPIFF